jgi:lysozyme
MSYIYGVDVSHNNGTVNWTKLKATGKCQFAILRISHGTTDDRQFTANLAACKRLNIPYGFYVYAESPSVSGAQAEARHALSKISGTKPMFVAYDAEDTALAANNKSTTTDVAWAFLQIVKAAGYTTSIYCNNTWLQSKIDVQYLKNKGAKFWYARYSGAAIGSYNSMCDMWQYSCTTNLSGNGSSAIDLDVLYNTALLKCSGCATTSTSSSYCDTTMDIKIKRGQTYTMATGSKAVTTGSSAIIQTAGQTYSGGKYLTELKAVGNIGQCAGVFVNGIKKFTATVS